jgi:hypothetical protein
MIWRITAIPINKGAISFVLGVILYMAEVIGFIVFMNFQYLFFP